MKEFKNKKVLILGSGGLRIGQAGEFDYSGSQAIKAFKEEGLQTILVNPNIATVQTDACMADHVYLEPLNPLTLRKIIEKERPDFITLSFGGQTALNLGLKLEEEGIYEKHGIKILGTNTRSIRTAEDREAFKQNLHQIGIPTPKSFTASNLKEAKSFAKEIGYPLMIRSGFSLGGLGSGKINSEEELILRVTEALSSTPHVLIEEYLFGFKEVEYEIVRDHLSQTLAICNMENFDPMGVHTGESIVIAPSQTLNNHEYHLLRDAAMKIANHFNVLGECNVQFALDPKSSSYRVIEMNPRLSRSSALASKATGYPLAFVAAKIALGYNLHEIKNKVTGKTTAFFEPALDYITLKIPRWDIQKLQSAERKIGTEMKSVGEVMAIGRSFPEVLQKGLRMLNIGVSGITDYPHRIPDLEKEIQNPTDRRLFALYAFFKRGGSVDKAHQLSQIDRWFLEHVFQLARTEKVLEEKELSPPLLKEAKQMGFSDLAIGKIKNVPENKIREKRLHHHIRPIVKQIDTLAGEFDAITNYLYMTYHGEKHDIEDFESATLVIGSGPYCIGSSVEFDWCAVNMARLLRERGRKTIIINSNPETVSTDFDESDKLYFEELTFERVKDIYDFETIDGIVVSVGGQIANNLALPLELAGCHLLGTKGSDIDRAENRDTFSSLLKTLDVDQPPWIAATDLEKAKTFADLVGYPVLIRPSYVLSGAAMNIVKDERELTKFLEEAALISPDHPVVMSKFILNAKEIELDGIASGGDIVISAIAEHVENAGVHSGDATLVLPPQRLHLETIRRIKRISRQVVKALDITGPFNMQFIAKDNHIQVIECNVRASRSLPFVSKVTNHNFIKIAGEILIGAYTRQNYETLELDYVGVKSPQFSYQRLKGANPVARVEMASTGEVACFGSNIYEAFFSSWLATEQKIRGKNLLISISSNHRERFLEDLKRLEASGWRLYSTEGTHRHLTLNGIGSAFVHKASEKYEPNVLSLIEEQKVDLIINIPKTATSNKSDGYKIRRLAIDHHIPLVTNAKLSHMFLKCLLDLKWEKVPVKSWQEYTASKTHY